jgi:hypothetical protein
VTMVGVQALSRAEHPEFARLILKRKPRLDNGLQGLSGPGAARGEATRRFHPADRHEQLGHPAADKVASRKVSHGKAFVQRRGHGRQTAEPFRAPELERQIVSGQRAPRCSSVGQRAPRCSSVGQRAPRCTSMLQFCNQVGATRRMAGDEQDAGPRVVAEPKGRTAGNVPRVVPVVPPDVRPREEGVPACETLRGAQVTLGRGTRTAARFAPFHLVPPTSGNLAP